MKWLRGGPRKHLFFRPDEVKAAIVTCGGICPGVNVIVRELTMSLYYNYKVKDIYGIPHGFQGFYSNEWKDEWKKLSPDLVKSIHHLGGTYLGTSRGGFDLEKIIDSLNEKRINQVRSYLFYKINFLRFILLVVLVLSRLLKFFLKRLKLEN